MYGVEGRAEDRQLQYEARWLGLGAAKSAESAVVPSRLLPRLALALVNVMPEVFAGIGPPHVAIFRARREGELERNEEEDEDDENAAHSFRILHGPARPGTIESGEGR